MLGYRSSAREVVATHLTRSGPLATHERDRFVPDYEHDSAVVADIFDRTKGASTYLGDWHSHPRSEASLSSKDRNTLVNIATSGSANQESPIMIVLAKPIEGWHAKAWQGSLRRLGPFRWLRADALDIVEY